MSPMRLTSAPNTLTSPCGAQCSTSVYLRPSWGWTSCARPSLGWARLQSLCCRSSSSLSQRRAKWGASWSATPVSLHSRYLQPPAFLCAAGPAYQPADAPPLISAQICHEFERFATYMPSVKVANFFGGFPLKSHQETLKKDCPTVIVGTPGRLCQVRPPTAG